jgi:NhaA family Na+:H+ antiporter
MIDHRRLISRVLPFQRFVRTETAGGLLLLGCACLALAAANSPFADSYERLWSIPIAISALDHTLSLSLHHWINDGLMSIFFLLVGLEIKRELLAGELASPRQAALPIAGAIGGMVLPAALYLMVNHDGVGIRGWGIPMATDIAFALGTLSLIAPRAPTGLKVFLAAFAIVDDMGAVLVIALFYTGAIVSTSLTVAVLILGGLLALNVLGVSRLAPYLLLGLALWFFVHASGVHATIAGVLLAMTIPTRTRINASQFSDEARKLLDEFDRTETGDYIVLTSKGQQEAIEALERASEAVTAPLLRLERALHGLSAFLVMPLFALSNAGVALARPQSGGDIALGVVLGLVVGKPLGITMAALAAVRLQLARLPAGVRWASLHGCAWLGGIGFTMSLFIATLAFDNDDLLASAKLGIIAGSSLSGLAAAIFLRLANSGVDQ